MTLAKTASVGVMISQTEKMKFGWWNTGLSPVGKAGKAKEDKAELAAKIVRVLIDDLEVDCLGLGEVTHEDMCLLRGGCSRSSLGVFNGTLRDRRLQFDTGIIYSTTRLEVFAEESLIALYGKRRIKAANHVRFLTTTDRSILDIFVTHWPSRG